MRSSVKALATGILVATWVISSAAIGQPSGGTVVFGGATIGTPNSTTTLIKQTTNAAIINWQSFSLNSGTSVVFDQPGAAAIALNRVLGGGVSQIDGSLSANGQVWIINANGILFGKGSQVNVAGLLATTSDIANGDFASGQYNFTSASSNPAASVENAGSIHVAGGGSAVLSAPHVSNAGLIQADGGQIVLGGANAFTVDFAGDDLLRYQISAPVAVTPTDANGTPQKELVANSGTLSAAGGRILLTARAAANVADNVVNNTGMISANSVSVHNGEVILDAGSGSVQDSGTISTTGNGAGETGGNVALAGNSVTVADNAVIDASGDQGGGSVSIGGGLHGSGPYQSAENTDVGNATIHADAHTSGNGGTVSIWSTGTTRFAGTVTATGGSKSGNGGMVETSGHLLSVEPTASVSTTAAQGTRGDWLLDPLNLTIVDDPSLPNPLVNGTLPYNFCGSCNSTISAQVVVQALTTTDVTLQAFDDIFVNAAISSGAGHTLMLDAGRSIFVNANIDLTGNGGTVILSAKNPGAHVPGGPATDPGAASISGSGVISADFVTLVDTSNGSDGGSIGSSAAPLQIGGGKVSVQTGGADVFLEASNKPGGAVPDLLLGNIAVGAGQLTAIAAGNLTIATGATITSSNDGDAVVLSAGQDFINDSGSGAVSLTGGGRFLIYSKAPAGDTFGGLDSANTAVWNTTYPTPISAAGSRYVFAEQPTLTFTSTDLSKTYGSDGSAALPSAYTVSGFDPGVAGAYLGDTAATAFSGAPGLSSAGAAAGASVSGGPYQITIATGSLVSTSGYAFQFVSSGLFTVNPALLEVTANPQSKVYGTADPTLTYTFSGLVNDDTSAVFSGALGRAAGENVGNYAINQGTLSAGANYTIDFTGANFAITQALLSVSANAQTKVYGAKDPKLTFTFSGLVNGDTSAVFTGALTRDAGQNVGNYAITQGTLAASNYTISFTGANFAITPATLTYIANSTNRTYGSDSPALSGKVTGFVNGDTLASATSGTLSFTTSATQASNVGTYAVTGSGLSANNGNYVFVQAQGNATALTINPATLTYVATSGTIDQGAPIPVLTGMVTGFVNGDTLQSATTGTLTFTTIATSASPPGVYAINGSGLSANHGNYVFVQDVGNATALTINNIAPQNVGLGGYFPWTSGGDRPGDGGSSLGQYDNGGEPVYVVPGGGSGGGASDLPSGDVTSLSGPIAELAAAQGYVEPPTNADRRSSSLSRYFDNGSLFDNNFPSWGNDAFWP
ncbi:MAG TPA: MBG domain-containing protein [Rhizomicrobium sp.]|jgi:filamentous hemagglutinin family protein|nr:MBG domain-containing protein [Rhizomicrobium sp.]